MFDESSILTLTHSAFLRGFPRDRGRMAGVAPMPYIKLVEETVFTKFVRLS
jgi:hypothetical protein